MVNWFPFNKLPVKAGWYAAAIIPANYDDLTAEQANEWREKFGFTKVWFNPDSIGFWWEPNPHGQGSNPIGHRLTHWAELPQVPALIEKLILPKQITGYGMDDHPLIDMLNENQALLRRIYELENHL
jgi:hypothetical protein